MNYLGEITGSGIIHGKKGVYFALEIDGEINLAHTQSQEVMNAVVTASEDYVEDINGGMAARTRP